MREVFRKFANKISHIAGSPWMFVSAVLIVILWASTGPLFEFSDTWQLVINTGTTIVTFMMVFLIQNTQNRDGKAVQLKLDELIRSTRARNAFVNLEDLTDEELAVLNAEFREVRDKQATSPVMKKLHNKIEEEHARRVVAHQPLNVLRSINENINKNLNRDISSLNPLGRDKTDKQQ